MRHNHIDAKHFQCCRCGEVQEREAPQSDEELLQEFEQNFQGDEAVTDHTVCDDCYDNLLANITPFHCVAGRMN